MQGGPDGPITSIKRSAYEGRYRRWKGFCKKREKQSREKIFAEHLRKREKSKFDNFENHTNTPVREK